MVLPQITPTLELCVDLNQFANVHLFQVGYFQVRVALKNHEKHNGAARIEVQVPRLNASHLFPGTLIDGRAVSTTLEIVYVREEITLLDQINYTIHLANRIDKIADTLKFTLSLELWYLPRSKMVTDTKEHTELHTAFECVSRRECHVRVHVARGLHCHRSVLFDFYHCAAVSFTVHAALVAGTLKPTTQHKPENEKDFGKVECDAKEVAYHKRVCLRLLQAYESLQHKIQSYMQRLPSRTPIRIGSTQSRRDVKQYFAVPMRTAERLNSMTRALLDAPAPRNAIEHDCINLSDELTVLWRQFLELFRCRPEMQTLLAQDYHVARVRRFGEFFFRRESALTIEHVNSYCGAEQHQLVELLRGHKYFIHLPELPISCSVLDGKPSTLPIIFEDHFVPCTSPTTSTARTCISRRLIITRTRTKSASFEAIKMACSLDDVNVAVPCSTPVRSVTNRNGIVKTAPASVGSFDNVEITHDVATDQLPRSSSVTVDQQELDTLRHKPKRHVISNSCERSSVRAWLRRMSTHRHHISKWGTGDGGAMRACARADALTYDYYSSCAHKPTLLPTVDGHILEYAQYKHQFKAQMVGITGDEHAYMLYSDHSTLGQHSRPHLCANLPTMSTTRSTLLHSFSEMCLTDVTTNIGVHGLDGSRDDLRIYENYIRLAYPNNHDRLDFLLAESVQEHTYGDMDEIADSLVNEILVYISKYDHLPGKISFIGHSMGAVVVRAVVANERLSHLRANLCTFLSLNAPHCGVHNNRSMSLVQWWTESTSLRQLSLRDVPVTNLEQAYMCRLAHTPSFIYFRHVLLVGSAADMYVPVDSALIRPASTTGAVDRSAYGEWAEAFSVHESTGEAFASMVDNLLRPLVTSNTHFVRYTAYHSTANVSRTHQMTGRAAHLAVLDDDIFIEKLLNVSLMQYLSAD